MTPEQIAPLFTDKDGAYHFARWGRPIAPIVFGVEDETLSVVKGALEAVASLAEIEIAETDPELGSNLMFFFFRDWDELLDVPDLGKLIPNLTQLVAGLKSEGASRYRAFRFDKEGAIKAAFVFLRMDKKMQKQPADLLALDEMVRVSLLWSSQAFAEMSPLAIAGKQTILRPEIGALIRASYDARMPNFANDASHALRLSARMTS